MNMPTEASIAAPADRPGFAVERLVKLIREAKEQVGLDLAGMTVLTEAATGAYGVTAPLAALAGAKRVYCLARSSRYGSAREAGTWTRQLAGRLGVDERITIAESLPHDMDSVDIVTNSGHLRPIGAQIIGRLHPGAVIALMFEAWELRHSDIDVPECHKRGIRIVGVNERHGSIDVFSYLGPLCVGQLQSAGLPVYRNRIAVLCDNDFAPFILRTLIGIGAEASLFKCAEDLPDAEWDCVVVALHPGPTPRIGPHEATLIAGRARRALVAQFWGDIDRAALNHHGMRITPFSAPKPGHMAVLLSEIGPDPIVRLQSGGLRAAEYVFHGGALTPAGIAQLVQPAQAKRFEVD